MALTLRIYPYDITFLLFLFFKHFLHILTYMYDNVLDMHCFISYHIWSIRISLINLTESKILFVPRDACDHSNILYNKKSHSDRKEQEESLGCQDRYQALEHETLPLSLGQHKAKTQPRQLTNMVADDSRLPHSSFNSSRLLLILSINSTYLSPYRATKKGRKQNLSRNGSSHSSSSTSFSAGFALCQMYIGTHTWLGECRNHVSGLFPVATSTAE